MNKKIEQLQDDLKSAKRDLKELENSHQEWEPERKFREEEIPTGLPLKDFLVEVESLWEKILDTNTLGEVTIENDECGFPVIQYYNFETYEEHCKEYKEECEWIMERIRRIEFEINELETNHGRIQKKRYELYLKLKEEFEE